MSSLSKINGFFRIFSLKFAIVSFTLEAIEGTREAIKRRETFCKSTSDDTEVSPALRV